MSLLCPSETQGSPSAPPSMATTGAQQNPKTGHSKEEGCLCKRFLEAYPWSPLGVKSIPGVPGVHAPNFLLLEGEGTKVSASESGIFAKPKISWLLGLENEWLLKTGSCNF